MDNNLDKVNMEKNISKLIRDIKLQINNKTIKKKNIFIKS